MSNELTNTEKELTPITPLDGTTIAASAGSTEEAYIGTPQYQALQQRLGFLEESLTTQDPLMKGHLKEIHKMLVQHEELVHLLSEDEIAKIMQGQQVITNTVLVAAVTAKSAKAGNARKAAQLSLGDL